MSSQADEDAPFDAPDGWTWVSLGQLALFINGDRSKNYPSKEHRVSFGIPFINAGHLKNGSIDYSEMDYITEERFALLNGGKVNPDDILYCLRGSLGKCALVRQSGKGAIASSLVIVRVNDACSPNFTLQYLQSPLGQSMIRKYDNGSAQPNLSAADLAKYVVPLPPEREQHRIVDRVEELLEQVKQAKERLDRVPLILKRFRQAVLAAACSGELTREWREKAPSGHGSKTALELAANERRKAWLAAGRSRKASSYSAPSSVDGNRELPSSWQWTSGREMFLWGSGAFLPKNKMTFGSIPVYGGNGVSGHHNEALVEPPTLVIGRVGALCGNVHVTDGPAWVTDNAIFALWVASVMNLDFARMLFENRNLNANAGGSGQPFVSQELLDSQVLPFPPPEEQTEIVGSVRRLFALADTIERRVQAAAGRANKLPQAILSKAFSGELVPTEADLARLEGRTYETAEELLKRVTALGSKAPPTQGKGRGRRTRKAE